MRLALFITNNKASILQAWEDFARTIAPAAMVMVVSDNDLVRLTTIMLAGGEEAAAA